ncbi:hypothetical protein D3C71_2204670 [compost metagenome]
MMQLDIGCEVLEFVVGQSHFFTPGHMPLDHLPFLRRQLVLLVQDAPGNFQLADIMNQRPQGELSLRERIQI